MTSKWTSLFENHESQVFSLDRLTHFSINTTEQQFQTNSYIQAVVYRMLKKAKLPIKPQSLASHSSAQV